MGYTLVESYDPTCTVEIDGQSFPAICLVEDEDGVRILLTTRSVTRHAEEASAKGGAQGVHWDANPHGVFYDYHEWANAPEVAAERAAAGKGPIPEVEVP